MKGQAIVMPLAVLYSMTMIGSIGGGWFPSYFMSRGDAPYDGRMKAMLVIAFFRCWCYWRSHWVTSVFGCRCC